MSQPRETCVSHEKCVAKEPYACTDLFYKKVFFTGEIFTEEIVSQESSEVCAGRMSVWMCEGGGGVVMVYLQKRPMGR